MSKEGRLVFSTDKAEMQSCARCGQLKLDCQCKEDLPINQIQERQLCFVLRLENSGRGGKTVTVIDKLPHSSAYLKELTSQLKKSCGSGGTFKMEAGAASIEIQGDKRSVLKTILEKRGIKVKGAF